MIMNPETLTVTLMIMISVMSLTTLVYTSNQFQSKL